MGKYIKNSKIAGDVSVKDISLPTTFGFCTRAAKNLSLRRLRSHSTSPSDDADSFRYLQLRSRHLVKLPSLTDTRKQHIHNVEESQTRNPRANSVPAEEKSESEKKDDCVNNEEKYVSDSSFGENGFDIESEDRKIMPCSLRRDSEEAIVTSSREIEDFFAYAEHQQQGFFMEKYNFDIVSDNPLQGRYEWIKMVP